MKDELTMKRELKELMGFVRLTHRFQQIRRTNLAADGERENDAEHSYQLALVAWYLKHSLDVDLDIGRLLSYALVHDLPEVYAGDVDPYYSSRAEIDAKKEKEEEAIGRLRIDFWKLGTTIDEYEKRKTHNKKDDEDKDDGRKEAAFVYALDKLLVFLNIYMLSDPYYTILESKKGVSMEADMDRQKDKTEGCPEIKALFSELRSIVFAKETGELGI